MRNNKSILKTVTNRSIHFIIPALALAMLVLAALACGGDTTEDGFADNLVIPTGIAISEPQEWDQESPGGQQDTIQTALLAALEQPGNNDPSITAMLSSLVQLQQQNPELFRRYLAANPAWRVFREHGDLFATRRWMIGSQWRYELHGYYTQYDIDPWRKHDIPEFQSRLTLGLSGAPWARVSSDSTKMHVGETAQLALSTGNQMLESHCVIALDGWVVEIFEQSSAKERRLTKATLQQLEEELYPLASSPAWDTILQLLPLGSTRQGTVTLELYNSFQPGLYDSEIWVNPGEPGMVYLKAFEVTGGTPLSVNNLREYSGEWVGWSDDPQQLFLSNTHFTIFEGDWGKPYAARFEVWFAPDSGQPERKLVQKVFKIEGWQR